MIRPMLQCASTTVAPIQGKIFKACQRLSQIWVLWREATTTYIPKAGKTSNSLSWTTDRLVSHTFYQKLPPTSISTVQHAYMKGKSVWTAKHDVVVYIV